MIYFIERVDIDPNWANTHKGKIMQKAAKSFEHALIANPVAFKAMIAQLQNLGHVCDRIYRGNDLNISYSNGIVLIAPYNAESNPVCAAMYYSVVEKRLEYFQMRDVVVKAIEDIDLDITRQFEMKGGAR